MTELRTHYGEPGDGTVYHDDCGGEVWFWKDGSASCSACPASAGPPTADAVPESAGARRELLPIGYRFTAPTVGKCRIRSYRTQTADEFMRDVQPPYDYLVQSEDGRRLGMTHEFIADMAGIREGGEQS